MVQWVLHAPTVRDLFLTCGSQNGSVRYQFVVAGDLSTDKCISRADCIPVLRAAPVSSSQTSTRHTAAAPTARFCVLPRRSNRRANPVNRPVPRGEHLLYGYTCKPCSHSNGKRLHAGARQFRKSTSVNEEGKKVCWACRGFRFNNRTKFADIEERTRWVSMGGSPPYEIVLS